MPKWEEAPIIEETQKQFKWEEAPIIEKPSMEYPKFEDSPGELSKTEFEYYPKFETKAQTEPQITPRVTLLPSEERKIIESAVSTGDILKGYGLGITSTVKGVGGALKAIGIKDPGEKITSTIEDLEKRFLEVKDPSFVDKVAAGFGSATTFLVPGFGIAKGTKMLSFAPRFATWLGISTSAFLESMVEGGTVYEESKARGIAHEESQSKAIKTFLANLPINIILDKWIFNKFPEGKKLTSSLKGATQEAVQEGIQEIISNIALNDPIMQNVWDSVAIGGIVGGGIATGKALLETPEAAIESVKERIEKEKIKPSEKPEIKPEQEIRPEEPIIIKEEEKPIKPKTEPKELKEMKELYLKDVSKENRSKTIQNLIEKGYTQEEANKQIANWTFEESKVKIEKESFLEKLQKYKNEGWKERVDLENNVIRFTRLDKESDTTFDVDLNFSEDQKQDIIGFYDIKQPKIEVKPEKTPTIEDQIKTIETAYEIDTDKERALRNARKSLEKLDLTPEQIEKEISKLTGEKIITPKEEKITAIIPPPSNTVNQEETTIELPKKVSKLYKNTLKEAGLIDKYDLKEEDYTYIIQTHEGRNAIADQLLKEDFEKEKNRLLKEGVDVLKGGLDMAILSKLIESEKLTENEIKELLQKSARPIATKSGQLNEAIKHIKENSTAGILINIQREYSKYKKFNQGKVKKVYKTAEKIKEKLEEENIKVIDKAIDKIIKTRPLQLKQVPAEKLAMKILNQIKKIPKKKFDIEKQMIETLLLKVTEKLTPQLKEKKLTNLEKLTLAIEKKEQYSEVWEASKKIVDKKIDDMKISENEKNNKRKKLEEFKNEIIGIPYSKKLIKQVVQEIIGRNLNFLIKFSEKTKQDINPVINDIIEQIIFLTGAKETQAKLLLNSLQEELYLKIKAIKEKNIKRKKEIDKKLIFKKEKLEEIITKKLYERENKPVWGERKKQAIKLLLNKIDKTFFKQRKNNTALAEFTQRLKNNIILKATEIKPKIEITEQISELDILKEVIQNIDKYKQVITKTQSLIKEKYKNNQELLNNIDNYLGQILERPFGDKLITKIVKKEIKEKDININEIVKKYYKEINKYEKSLKEYIMEKAGLIDKEAEILENIITKEITNITNITKQKILKKMLQIKNIQKRENKTLIENIIELSNLGAFDTDQYFDIISEKYNIPNLNEELIKKIKPKIQKIQEMPEGIDKWREIELVYKEAFEKIPVNIPKKLSMILYIHQLLNFKTAIRNITGNTGFAILDSLTQTIVGVPIDIAISKFLTGERSLTVYQYGEWLKGAKEFGGESFFDVWQGIDTLPHKLKSMLDKKKIDDLKEFGLDFAGKYNLSSRPVFKKGLYKYLEKLTGIAMKSSDRLYFGGAFRESIANQMKITKSKEATQEMVFNAVIDGLYATFQDLNEISKLSIGVKKLFNLDREFGAGSLLHNYPKTPANLAMRAFAYSPLGLLQATKTLWHIKNSNFKGKMEKVNKLYHQKKAAMQLSRGFAGSGITGLGFLAAYLGIIAITDRKKRKVLKTKEALGIRNGSFNIQALTRGTKKWLDNIKKTNNYSINKNWFEWEDGDILYDIEQLQPVSNIILSGARLYELSKEIDYDKPIDYMRFPFEIAKANIETVETLSAVQGLRRMFSPQGIVQGGMNLLVGIPSAFVPTVSGQGRYINDLTMRDVKEENIVVESWNRILNKIPFTQKLPFINKLPPKLTVLGEPVVISEPVRNRSIFDMIIDSSNIMLNPAIVTRYKKKEGIKYLLDLYDRTDETKHLPRDIRKKKKITIGKREIELSKEERIRLLKLTNEQLNNKIEKLISKDKFRNLPYDQQIEKFVFLLNVLGTKGNMQILIEKALKRPLK